jgi:hypothetical protein
MRNKMENYVLMEYTEKNGQKFVTAVHYLDLSRFIKVYPDAKPKPKK